MQYSARILAPFIFITLLLFSCKEDVDLIGDFKETAVIYGLLDQADSIHYIKINRAFIGPGNSLDIAKIPDSSYFDQVDATITEVVNGATIRQWDLRDTLVDNKDQDGVFFAPTQKMYYFVTRKCQQTGSQQLNSTNQGDLLNSLNKYATYQLHVSLNGGEFEVKGETELISGISTSADATAFRFEFADNPSSYKQSGIAVSTGNAHIINTTLNVDFLEFTSNTQSTHKTFNWNLGETDVTPYASKTFTSNGKTFYQLIASNVSNDPAIIKRNLYAINTIVTAGSEELYNYMTINQPSSSLAQTKPTYTNLTVTNDHRVIGLFSSRFTYTIERFFINPNPLLSNFRLITQKSTEELCKGAITGNYLFCSQHPADNLMSYSCQ